MNEVLELRSFGANSSDIEGQSRFEKVISALGAPYARGDRFAIYRGDCLELLDGVPDASVNLSFTSPPYNIGKEYEKILSLEEYVEWSTQWFNKLPRLTVNNGSFVLNVGYIPSPGKAKALPLTYLLWDKVPFFLVQEIVWNYGAGVAGRHFLSPRNEKLLWFVKNSEDYVFNLDDIRDPDVAYPNQKKNGKLRCNSIGKNPSDVWQIAKVTSGKNRASSERTPHPAQFPRDLCERVLKGFSPINGIVLDPFGGSGSTADTALRTGLYAILFELRADYCEIAKERLQNTVLESASLF